MGIGSSFKSSQQNAQIYIAHRGKIHKIIFSRGSANQDLQDIVKGATNTENHMKIFLRDSADNIVQLSSSIQQNSEDKPYKLETAADLANNNQTNGIIGQSDSGGAGGGGGGGVAGVAGVGGKVQDASLKTQEALTQIVKEFAKAMKIDETRKELLERIVQLEKRLDVESLKAIEVEKCRKEVKDLREMLQNSSSQVRASLKPTENETMRKISLDNLPTYPKYQLSLETIEYLKTPTFNIWHWEANEMLSLLEHMYHELGLVKEFNINPITLKRWLLCIQSNYRNNPFHNFRHCFCVAQMMYGLIHLCELEKYFNKVEIITLLTAAICHDLDHPGYNNAYQINARTELAIRYNDISPLENHHCAVAFQILNNPPCNIFANIPDELFKEIRAGMVKLILATDMAKHKEMLELLTSYVDNFDYKNKDHMDALKNILIKCCDISNEVRPTEISEPWLDCLLEEYFMQSDREKQEGLPVAPFMDRDKVTKPNSQIGFIKFVLIPLFQTVSKLFPQLQETMVKPLQDAYTRYEEMKKQEEAAKAAAAAAAAETTTK